MPLYTRNVFTDLYADDTTLYYIHTSQNTIEQNLQVALNQLLSLRIVFKTRVISSIGKEIRLSCQMNLLSWFGENLVS